jgi:2-oxoisovalerate dehydrogenase E1 component
VLCSFGDASANHASALTGINAARYAVRRGTPCPILFSARTTGSASVDTPALDQETFGGMRYLRYFEADGEVDEVWDVVEEAIHLCRTRRLPSSCASATERLWGHAGSDIELAYRSQAEIEAAEARDPLLRNARRLVETGAATPAQLRGILRADRDAGAEWLGEEAAGRRLLWSRRRRWSRPSRPSTRAVREAGPDGSGERRAFWGSSLPEEATNPVRRTMAAHLSAALADEMLRRPEILVFGEDVGRKGGSTT